MNDEEYTLPYADVTAQKGWEGKRNRRYSGRIGQRIVAIAIQLFWFPVVGTSPTLIFRILIYWKKTVFIPPQISQLALPSSYWRYSLSVLLPACTG
jgi:hypothetical protein